MIINNQNGNFSNNGIIGENNNINNTIDQKTLDKIDEIIDFLKKDPIITKDKEKIIENIEQLKKEKNSDKIKSFFHSLSKLGFKLLENEDTLKALLGME